MFNQVAIPVTVSDMIEARNQALNLITHANKSLSKANEALKGLAGAFEQKLTVSPSRTHLKP